MKTLILSVLSVAIIVTFVGIGSGHCAALREIVAHDELESLVGTERDGREAEAQDSQT